jgi:hypothetical protein
MRIKFSGKLVELTPTSQLWAMVSELEDFEDVIERMNKRVETIPGIRETDTMERHPLALHYFMGGCDWYITEWDGKDVFFGYTILNNDVEMSEWGYISKSELLGLDDLRRRRVFMALNLDFYCSRATVEEALYHKNPDYFARYKPE